MNKSFFSYVFRPKRVLIVFIALIGMLGNTNDGIYFLIFLGSVINIVCRSVSYFIDLRIHKENKHYE